MPDVKGHPTCHRVLAESLCKYLSFNAQFLRIGSRGQCNLLKQVASWVPPSKSSLLSRAIKLSLDQDGNGSLDFKELGTALRSLGLELDDKETTDLLQAFDKEENGLRRLHLTWTNGKTPDFNHYIRPSYQHQFAKTRFPSLWSN